MWRIFIPNGEACVPVGAIADEDITPEWKLYQVPFPTRKETNERKHQ